jgi:hypothetical protein
MTALALFSQAVDAVHEGENYEVRRLVRMPRYFDDDFELAALRCFRCGGGGQGLTLAHFRAQLEDLQEHIAHVRAQLEHLQDSSTDEFELYGGQSKIKLSGNGNQAQVEKKRERM